jgi:hypothetical protein
LVILASSVFLTVFGINASLVFHVPDGIMLALFMLLFTCHYLAMGKINELAQNDRRTTQAVSATMIINHRQADRRANDNVIFDDRRSVDRRTRNIPINFEDRRKAIRSRDGKPGDSQLERTGFSMTDRH